MNNTFLVVAVVFVFLTGCGGGGDAQQVLQISDKETIESQSMEVDNGKIIRDEQLTNWYVNPLADLPNNGQDGLRVELSRPKGKYILKMSYVRGVLENLGATGASISNNGSGEVTRNSNEIKRFQHFLWQTANQAYLQWARHLEYDPESVTIIVGGNCGGNDRTIACYSLRRDVVILTFFEVQKIYHWFRGDSTLREQAKQIIFSILSHESGHQFRYSNPEGNNEGCGSSDNCHAPEGSGSVLSYDHLLQPQPGSVRYYVTEEDIQHIPNASWNDDDVDNYRVWQDNEYNYVDKWGIWINHRYKVDGMTAVGSLYGGRFSIIDKIEAAGWIEGRRSVGVNLTQSATWGGSDNFLGVDLSRDYLGALLRADANLRYTFGNQPKLNLRVNNFEAHYHDGDEAKWHEMNVEDRVDNVYDISCTSDGCSGESVKAYWYPGNAGDPTGLVGGILDDTDKKYVGSFVAEKN